MKYNLFFVFLLLAFALCASDAVAQIGDENAQPSAREILRRAVDHAATASMYRDRVGWDSVRSEIARLSVDADSVADLAPAMRYLFSALGDEHARLIHNNKPIAFYRGPQKAHLAGMSSEQYNKIQMGQIYEFGAQLLEPGIGYVRLVGLPPMGDNVAQASVIQRAVCGLKADGARDWVVDLRYNGGGNMHPMAEGLAAVLGEGPAGGAVGLTETENAAWRVEDSDFYYDDFSIRLEDDCPYDTLPKVAVLTSMYTASSGEVVAVAFKGRDKTRFFGEKTLGMTTVNDWTVLDDASFLLISVSTYQSRDGVVHSKYVAPDEYVVFQPDVEVADDKAVQKAIAWLRSE